MGRRTRGFTLLEIMIALAMVGTVLTLAYSSFATASRTIERREAYARALHRADFVLRHLTDQLQSVHLDAAAYYRLADPGDLFAGGGDTVGFWTHTPPQARRELRGTLQWVEYRLEAGDESTDAEGMILVCEGTADLADVEDKPQTRWAVPVDTVVFEYLGEGGWSGGWDIETEGRLPYAVRATVRVRHSGEELLELETVIALPVTGFTQVTPPEAGEAEVAPEDEDKAEPLEPETQTPTPGRPRMDQQGFRRREAS